MVNGHVCKIGISSIHVKELPGQSSFHHKYDRSHTQTNVRHLQRTKVYVFSDSVLCPGKIFENPHSNDAWEQRLGWLKSSSEYRNFDRIDGEPMEFEWNIFPGFNTLQLSEEVKRLLCRLDETPEKFHRKKSIYVDVQRHFLWNKDNET